MKLNFYQSQKQKSEAHVTNNSLVSPKRQHNIIDIRRQAVHEQLLKRGEGMAEEIARRDFDIRSKPEQFYKSNDPKVLNYRHKIEGSFQ